MKQILLAFCLAVFCISCKTTDAKYQYNNNIEIGCFITHFQNEKLEISKPPRPLYTGTVRAQSGLIIPIGKGNNPREVGIFKFDAMNKKHLARLKRIDESGTIYIQGKQYDAIINGAFVLFEYESHIQKDAIVKAFNRFDTQIARKINSSIRIEGK